MYKTPCHANLWTSSPRLLDACRYQIATIPGLTTRVRQQIATGRYFCPTLSQGGQRRLLEARAAQSSTKQLVPCEQQSSAQNLRFCRQNTAAGWFAALSLIALATALILQNRYLRKQEQAPDEIQDEFMHNDGVESMDYQTVLTSVRQVTTFRQAVQSMRSGDNARAMVELHRVLEHNSICRTPLNTENFSKDDLEDMYRLHLQNSELPLQYSILLHLRQLFDLSTTRAEELENELKGNAYQFSI